MATGTLSPATFVWRIPRFLDSVTSCTDCSIQSPDFQLPDSRWFLKLIIYDLRVTISLFMRDSLTPESVTYTIKVNLYSGVRELNGTAHFDSDNRNARGAEILTFWSMILTSNSNLLITCNIKCNTPHPVADLSPGKDIVSCAVQTEVANTVIEKENPKNEEWSSLDIKDNALLRERMKQLLTKGSDHDVTICVQDKEFRAHRNILRARSPVFAMMLSHDTKENNTGTITIEDCDPESFDEFLLYVYSGTMENLTPSKALQLYYPADKYDFPVLKDRCVNLLKTSLSIESICDVVLMAAKHQEKELLDVATEFFARNMKKIVVTVGWQKFMAQNLVVANELIIKSMEILQPED